MGCEQQRVGCDGIRGSDGGGVAIAESTNSKVPSGGAVYIKGCSLTGVLRGDHCGTMMRLRRQSLW